MGWDLPYWLVKLFQPPKIVENSGVAVRVVHVRHMRVHVSHWPVFMGMCVWFAGRIISAMGVLVVDVVHVRMCMHEALVNMLVLMMFCQV